MADGDQGRQPAGPVTAYNDNDGYYHNGALMLETTNFYGAFRPQQTPVLPTPATPLPYASVGAYDTVLHQWEPLSKAKALVANSYFNDVIDHRTDDAFWQARDISRHLHNIHAAVLVVGGWFDAEDLNGPYKTSHIKTEDAPTIVGFT